MGDGDDDGGGGDDGTGEDNAAGDETPLPIAGGELGEGGGWGVLFWGLLKRGGCDGDLTVGEFAPE